MYIWKCSCFFNIAYYRGTLYIFNSNQSKNSFNLIFWKKSFLNFSTYFFSIIKKVHTKWFKQVSENVDFELTGLDLWLLHDIWIDLDKYLLSVVTNYCTWNWKALKVQPVLIQTNFSKIFTFCYPYEDFHKFKRQHEKIFMYFTKIICYTPFNSNQRFFIGFYVII